MLYPEPPGNRTHPTASFIQVVKWRVFIIVFPSIVLLVHTGNPLNLVSEVTEGVALE